MHVLLPLILILSLGSSAAVAQTQEEAAIKALAERYHQAWTSHDAGALAALYEANGVVAGADGTIVSGRAAIERLFGNYFAGPWRQAELDLEIQDIRVLSGDVAVVYGAYTINGGFDGTTTGRYMQTLVKQDGEWQIAGSQAMTPAQPGN